MHAYYNEIDSYAAGWLRNLIAAGHIAPGEVDERDIRDVAPADLAGFVQCHFFAGVGVWSYALRRAGWPDDRPVWTGSCPCQPFSAAGKGGGFDDERHLWPSWHWLIEQRRPAIVLGEQVASGPAGSWLDLVQDDVEALGYAFGAVPFPSAGVGAPHIRDRLYWVADANGGGSGAGRGNAREVRCLSEAERQSEQRAVVPRGDRRAGGVDDALGARLEGQRSGHSASLGHGAGSLRSTAAASEPRRLADADGRNASAEGLQRGGQQGQQPQDGGARRVADTKSIGSGTGFRNLGPAGCGEPIAGDRGAVHDHGGSGPINGFWRDADWLLCRDGKWRPVEPGTFPLAHGATSRVGRLRAYGNAINAEAAVTFVRACLSSEAREAA